MKISIIILHYGSLNDTKECLDSLSRLDDSNYDILLIDNTSSEEGLVPLQAQYPRITLIRNDSNLGYAEGNNRGMQLAFCNGAEAALLLNNDTVVDPYLLRAFREAAEQNPSGGVFGAKIYYYNNPTLIWHAGGTLHPKSFRAYHYGCLDSDLDKQWETPSSVDYVCGCALFVHRAVFKRVGGFAPEFFLNWEEIDWCWRIRKEGFSCHYVPTARVWHKISSSFEGGKRGALWHYYYARNRLLFLSRNFSWKQRGHFYTTIFLKECLRWIYSKDTPQEKANHRASLTGVRDYFLKRFYKCSHLDFVHFSTRVLQDVDL